jgi:hypothetical protein
MLFQLKQIYSEGKSRKILFALLVGLWLRLPIIFYGGVGLLRMYGAYVDEISKKEV